RRANRLCDFAYFENAYRHGISRLLYRQMKCRRFDWHALLLSRIVSHQKATGLFSFLSSEELCVVSRLMICLLASTTLAGMAHAADTAPIRITVITDLNDDLYGARAGR